MTNSTTVPEYFIPYYFDPLNWLLKAVGLTSSLIGLLGNAVVLVLIFGSNKFRRYGSRLFLNFSISLQTSSFALGRGLANTVMFAS